MPTSSSRPAARRQLLRQSAGAALGLGLGLGAWPVLADEPKTVRLLVGFPAGGGTDAIARALAEQLRVELGSTVVVENKPGAGGQIAAQTLKAATPDGSTLFVSHDHTISILPMVTRHPGFDPAADFVPVAGFASLVNCFAVSPGTPAKSFNEYLAWLRGPQGGKGAVGIPAPASVPEFLVKMIGDHYKLDLINAPYRGSAPMIGDMLGNQIAAGVGTVPDFIEQHRAGKLRIVAVLGDSRQALLPDVPTFAELGLKGFEERPYFALFAPARTPRATLDRLSIALAKTVATPSVRDRLTAMGLTVSFMPQADITRRIEAYNKVWSEVIRRSGFQPQ